MLAKRRFTRGRISRAAVAAAGLVVMTTVADVAHAADPPPTPLMQALNTINGVTGAIANAYGTFQAAQFILSTFFGVSLGMGESVADAVRQIEAQNQGYRNNNDLAYVPGDLDQVNQIFSNSLNGGPFDPDMQWGLFVNNCDQHISRLAIDIQNGDMTDAYILAPPYSTLVMSCAWTMKQRAQQDPSYTPDQYVIDGWAMQLLQTNYSLVGAVTINMDASCSVQSPSSVPGESNVYQWTQGGKRMWQKYATKVGIDCDLYRGCNTISTELSCCNPSTGGSHGSYFPTPDAVRAILTSKRRAFLADPAVMSVRTAMAWAAANLSSDQNVIADGSITWDTNRNAPYCQGHLGL